MALTALVAVVVCVTLVPALLAIFGHTIFWPGSRSRKGVPGAAPEEVALTFRRLRYCLAHLATSKPAAAALVAVCTAVLLAAASGLRDLRLDFTLMSGLPANAETRRAADAAGKGLAPGILSPTEVVVEAPGIVHRRESLARLEALLGRERGVAGVVGPREQPTAFRGAALARTGSAARYALIFEDDPIGAAAIHDLGAVEAAMPALLGRSGLRAARVSYAGETALAQETVDSTVGDLRRIALVALAVNLVLLAVFLRALVAPVLLLVASILALAATLGLTTIVFQKVLGYGELTYYVPFAAAVLLVALGSDYNVFVAGQMWDEARRRPLREAIALAAPRASKAITVAGMALAFSFAFLAIVPLRAFREFAFAMCLGVLLDALVVRSLLVPALVSLFGEASWWPGRRRRAPSVSTRRAEGTTTVGMSGRRAGARAERARSTDVGRS